MSEAIKNLNSLFQLGILPVAAVRDGRICYFNPAAEEFFNQNLTGREAHEIFPRWPYACGTVVSTDILGRNCIVTVSQLEDILVLTLSKAVDPKQTASIPSGAISRMASTITTLRLAADKLADLCEKSEKQELYLSMLYHNYYKLIRTTDHLTTISKLNSGDFPFEPRNLELGAFLSDIVSSVRYLTADSGVTLEYEPPDRLITVNADAKLIEQLVLSLISNSLKHTPAGGTVKLSVCEKNGHAALTVDDTGCGISPERMGSLFRLEEHEAPADTPLGLPLASAIASRHKGTIIIESRPGEGTSVRVLLRACNAPPTLNSPALHYGNNIPIRALTELSVVLPRTRYTRDSMKGEI